MIHSMTGYANATGAIEGYSWNCEIRSVNARGLDIRVRCPDWIEGLEPQIRALLQKALSRGSVSLFLRLNAEESGSNNLVDPDRVTQIIEAIGVVEEAAKSQGLKLGKPRAIDVLNMRATSENSTPSGEAMIKLRETLLAAVTATVGDFVASRKNEGDALAKVLNEQINQVESLYGAATGITTARQDAFGENLKANLRKVTDNTEGVDPERVAQELALIAVKSDITEELDRLSAHISASRELLAKGGPVGRKFDFLCQEFNREANTLCSKAQFSDLTRVGLDLKVVIDQMREQIQNVE